MLDFVENDYGPNFELIIFVSNRPSMIVFAVQCSSFLESRFVFGISSTEKRFCVSPVASLVHRFSTSRMRRLWR